jgi:hypothetical protein
MAAWAVRQNDPKVVDSIAIAETSCSVKQGRNRKPTVGKYREIQAKLHIPDYFLSLLGRLLVNKYLRMRCLARVEGPEVYC